MSDDRRMPKRPKPIPGVEIRPRRRRDGTGYYVFRVRWINEAGVRDSEEFATAQDALDFKAHVRMLKRRGRLDDLDRGRETLTEFADHWWQTYAAGNLERATLKAYATTWNVHLLPRVGHLQLREITPPVVAKLRADMERDGIGAPTIRKAMAVLQSMLARAVEWGRAYENAVRAVKKPKAKRKRAVIALDPAAVEALRAQLLPHHAALVSVLAYAGLRPEEALALEWRHVRRGTLLVEQKNIGGQIVAGQKTHRPPRTVDLLPSLAQDLRYHRLAQPPTGDDGLVFPAAGTSDPRSESSYRNWRAKIFQPAAERAGLAIRRPYDLRHSYASLRLHEQHLSLLEVAAQMGHGVQMLSDTYAHIIAELKGTGPVDPDALIRAARAGQAPEEAAAS